jgi:hypothetical protein
MVRWTIDSGMDGIVDGIVGTDEMDEMDGIMEETAGNGLMNWMDRSIDFFF